jgi:hypothetical protein
MPPDSLPAQSEAIQILLEALDTSGRPLDALPKESLIARIEALEHDIRRALEGLGYR